MPKEFIVVVVTHRKLGDLLFPYVIDRKPGQSFFQLTDIITADNFENAGVELNESAIKLVKITSEYSEKIIHKLFSKKKNLKDFFDTIENELLTEQIRPYIEKRIATCFEILSQNSVAIFRKEKQYQVVHDEEQLSLVQESVVPVFNFIHTKEDFKYFLTIRKQNKDLKLFNQPYLILTINPCIVLINKDIYRVENIDSKKLLPFFTKDSIIVTKANEKTYMSTFVKNAILNYPVKAIGFNILETNLSPQARLTLDSNLKGEPVLLLSFVYENTIFQYGQLSSSSVKLEQTDDSYIFYKTNRSLEWEEGMKNKLEEQDFYLQANNAFHLNFLAGEPQWQFYEMINWLNFNSENLRNLGFELLKGHYDKNYYLDSILLEMKVDEVKDWFDVHAIVRFGEFNFPFARFRKHIIMGIREFTLPDNQVVILPSAWFSQYREMFIFGDDEGDGIKLKKHHFQILREAMGADTGEMLLKIRNKLEFSQSEKLAEPEGLKATLREYQKTGVHWMFQLYRNNMGGCLADDMGLGKTLQTISLLLKVKDEEKKATVVPVSNKPTVQLSLFDIPAFSGAEPLSTSLIVMPVSLLHNWENEIKKFAPSLKVYQFFGTQRTRTFSDLLNVDVVLASYGVVRNDIERLSELNFKYIILDESQSIKNPDSKIYKAVIQLQSEHKLVLTGTPIENSLTDLWAQLNFLNRDLLKSQHYFREEFVIPIEKFNDEEKQRKLQMIISPFILRRKKEQVVKELPSLTEQVLFCDMTDQQREIYESEKSSVRNTIMDSIDKQGFSKSSILILKALNRLRLMANHPRLTEPSYTGDSGKFDEIIRCMTNIIEEKHKVLIFSSYVRHLNMVASQLREAGHPFEMLTGASKNRQNIVDAFQKNEETRVFLISLKAGGTGLNLTAADYVFILDPWWNPATENQAISRAHRIGQDKKVFVYRFLSRDTIEEKIQKLQQRKSAMADIFINSNNPFKSFGREEIEELFK